MNLFKGRFRLDPHLAPASEFQPTLSASGFHTFRAYTPIPSTPPAGSFQSDIASSKYQNRWESWTEFQEWLAEEQRTQGIELRLVNTYAGMPEFERQLRFVCSRGGTGGVKPYTKRHPDWNRKIESKLTDCNCRLLVKQYPGLPTVLGNYRAEHDHALGNANLPFTQIPKDTREYIAGLLRLKVSPDHIVRISDSRYRILITPLASIDPSRSVRLRRSFRARS